MNPGLILNRPSPRHTKNLLSMKILLKLSVCVLFIGLCFYSFINVQNAVTEKRIRLPQLAKELKLIQEENQRLRYEIEKFENPQYLIQLARHKEFSHLKYPLFKDVLTLKEGTALHPLSPVPKEARKIKPPVTFALTSN